MPESELPIRVIRERERGKRATYKQHAEVRRTIDRPSQVAASKEVITHRVNEQSRGQQEHLGRRIKFRQVVTEESLRRRRIAAKEQAREKYTGDVVQKTGVRPASIGIVAILFRIFIAVFLLSMLFLVVSRGQATGNAIQKVGYFLNNLTSSQPLFRKVS